MEMGAKLTAVFKKLGYKYVTLDLEGYRQGAMNEVLPILNNAIPTEPSPLLPGPAPAKTPARYS
jgi:hypothetical protein